MAMNGSTVIDAIKREMDAHLTRIEELLSADAIAVESPILFGLDVKIRDVLDLTPTRRSRLAVLLNTPGGTAEVAERIANTMRHYYQEVVFIVPDRAMSAGTILVMSGDEIMMDHFSVLGPIDPQIEREGKLIPALSYLRQYEEMREKSKRGELTTADMVLLQKLDLAELHWFEQARELSITLLKTWLTKYKFKSWMQTEDRKIDVTEDMRVQRAEEIARILSDHVRWHSHGRGIGIDTLRRELKLQVKNFDEIPDLPDVVRRYHALLTSYVLTHGVFPFVHTTHCF